MKGSQTNLDSFRIFLDLCRSKHFARTAARFYLSQSAVSQQIVFWEKKLGCRLVHRSRNFFKMTYEGERFQRMCEKIVHVFDDACHEIRKGELSFLGPIRVESIYSVGLYRLQRSILFLLRKSSKIKLHLDYGKSSKIYEKIQEGLIDFGIVAEPKMQTGIHIQKFRQKETLHVVFPHNHTFALSSSIPLSAFKKEPLVTFSKMVPTRLLIEKYFYKNKITPFVALEFDNVELIKKAVEVGGGVALLPKSVVDTDVRAGRLKSAPLQGESIKRTLAVIWKKGRVLNKMEREFIDFILRDK